MTICAHRTCMKRSARRLGTYARRTPLRGTQTQSTPMQMRTRRRRSLLLGTMLRPLAGQESPVRVVVLYTTSFESPLLHTAMATRMMMRPPPNPPSISASTLPGPHSRARRRVAIQNGRFNLACSLARNWYDKSARDGLMRFSPASLKFPQRWMGVGLRSTVFGLFSTARAAWSTSQ